MSIAAHAETSDIVDFLNELLEAERAGARVALESARQAAPGAWPTCSRTFATTRRDGAPCC